MPRHRPLSSVLRNCPDVLRNVEEGVPVYLTKNGTGRYAPIDIGDSGRMECAMRRGKRSGETQGWLSQEDMEAHFKGRVRA